jgi:hypothetical protein
LFQTSPKKLIGQRSEGDVLSLVGDQAGFADFAQFVQEEESCMDGGQPRRHGAFEVYRKPVSSKMTYLVYALNWKNQCVYFIFPKVSRNFDDIFVCLFVCFYKISRIYCDMTLRRLFS